MVRHSVARALAAVLVLIGMSTPLLAQITIEEELELTGNSMKRKTHFKKVMAEASSSPVSFAVQQGGPLKIIFENGRRFKDPLAKKTKMMISITNAEGRVKYKRTVFPADFFSEPVQGRLDPACSDMWHLYGEGPFTWQSGITTEMIDDAKVFSLNCSSDYAKETGNCRSTNYNPKGHISLWGWTWWGDSAIIRSLLRFEGLEFIGPVQLEEARLTLFASGSSQLSGSNAFSAYKITSAWDEYSVTWNTQPGFGSPRIDGPAGQSDVTLNVKPIVQSWLDSPGSNHGFGLALQNESKYRYRNFYSSESGSPPMLDVEVSNPDAQSDTLYVSYVNKGDQVTIEYESNGEVYTSNTQTQKTINGEEMQGQQFIFNVTGPTCGNQEFSEHLEAFGWVDPPEKIMLGETKYYATVKHPDDPQKILIKSVETDSKGEPVRPTNFVANPGFGSNPIEIISGGKSGVYWEDKWATIGSNGTIRTGNLPSGMIRLVGRYWEAGKEYRVNLKTKDGRGNLAIKIVKPKRLGDKFGKARDVFDKIVDIDSVIITNAGKFGVPPQFVKAHISEEAAPKSFGAGIGKGFAPSYLYEPYTVQFWNLRGLSGRFFIEDSSSSYYSDVPDHRHVLFRNYYKETKSVWEIVKNSSQLVDPSNNNTYGERTSSGKMDFGDGYTTVQNYYDDIYNRIAANDTLSSFEIAQIANKEMANFLRNEWRGGLKNHIAQTRAASSYGLLQMLHVTAREDVDYDIDRLPEDMNTNSFFEESVQHQRELLVNEIMGNGNDLNSNWANGYEATIRNTIFDTWNPKSGYAKGILMRVDEFLPSK